jgi:hypothetical protein
MPHISSLEIQANYIEIFSQTKTIPETNQVKFDYVMNKKFQHIPYYFILTYTAAHKRWGGGGHWDLRYSGISLFFLRYFGIFLEKLRYYDIGNLALHGICNSGIKNCGY